jgi:hypothetical protein
MREKQGLVTHGNMKGEKKVVGKIMYISFGIAFFCKCQVNLFLIFSGMFTKDGFFTVWYSPVFSYIITFQHICLPSFNQCHTPFQFLCIVWPSTSTSRFHRYKRNTMSRK